jgi:hypothetical protein
MGLAVYPRTCGARKKRGGLCRAPAGRGTPHPGYGSCCLHGGNTRTGEIAVARYEATAELARYGSALDVEPHEALLLCIRIAAGEVQSATEYVASLKENELLERPEELLRRPLHGERGAEEPRTVVQETRRLQAQLNVWIRIRQEAMDRLVRYSGAALRSGLEERLVQVAEVQGKLLAAAVHGILVDLGVADRPEAPAIVRKHLTTIAQHSREDTPTASVSDV